MIILQPKDYPLYKGLRISHCEDLSWQFYRNINEHLDLYVHNSEKMNSPIVLRVVDLKKSRISCYSIYEPVENPIVRLKNLTAFYQYLGLGIYYAYGEVQFDNGEGKFFIDIRDNGQFWYKIQ